MFQQSSAIVLRITKYSDNTFILHLYTLQHGRVNYLVNGSRAKKSANKVALFEPLTLLEIESKLQPNAELQRLRESRLQHPFVSIPYNMEKRSVAFFLAEVLFRTLKQAIENEDLFFFLQRAILSLDILEDVANFHLFFLVQLSQHLGFYPNLEGGGSFFNMESGEMCYERPLHKNFLLPSDCDLLKRICNASYETISEITMTRGERANLLRNIVTYYTLHLPEFHGLKSIDVLSDLFD